MTNSSSDSSLFEGPDFSSTEVEDDADAELDDEFDVVIDEIDVVQEHANRVAGGTAQNVLEHIARQIVDDPDAVVVDAGPGRNGLKLSLHVNPADMGRIIGKRGRVAQALRTVVRAAGARDGQDASVDIVD